MVDHDITPEAAERIQTEVQDLVESITKAYDDSRTRTGELTSDEATREDMLVVARELAEGQWGDLNMDKKAGIAAAAVWQTMMRSREGSQKSEQTYRAYALRDGNDPVAVLTVEDVSLPDETGNTDFDDEAIEAAKFPKATISMSTTWRARNLATASEPT